MASLPAIGEALGGDNGQVVGEVLDLTLGAKSKVNAAANIVKQSTNKTYEIITILENANTMAEFVEQLYNKDQ